MSGFHVRDISHFVGRCVKVVWEWSQEPLNQLILIVCTTIVFGSVIVVVFFHCVRNCQKWCHSRGSPNHHRRNCHCSNHPGSGSATLLPQIQSDGITTETQQPMLDGMPDHTCLPDVGDDDIRPDPPVDPSAPPVEEVVEVPEAPLPSSPPPPPYDELLELEDLTGIKLWEEENDSDELPPYEHFSRIDSRDGFVRISQV